MKKGLIIVIIITVLLIGVGIYYFAQNPIYSNQGTSNEEQPGESSLEVKIENFAFVPSTLTIKAGETITWKNMDLAPHIINSDSSTELDSESLGKGKTYSHTFNTAGTYSYYCAIHPSMKGEIIVTE